MALPKSGTGVVLAPLLLWLFPRSQAFLCGPIALTTVNKVLQQEIPWMNSVWRQQHIRTVGDCANVEDLSLLPCKQNDNFPVVSEEGFNPVVIVTVNYVTHLDEMRIERASIGCQTDDSGMAHHFLNLDMVLDVVMGADVNAVGVVSIPYPCTQGDACMIGPDLQDVVAHISGRLQCVDASRFRVELNPQEGVTFSKTMTLDIYSGVHYDATAVMKKDFKLYAENTTLSCDGHPVLGMICDRICGRFFQSTTTTTLALGEQCARATGGSCQWGILGCGDGKDCSNEKLCLCMKGSCFVDGACLPCDTTLLCDEEGCDAGHAKCNGLQCSCQPGACVTDGKCQALCSRDTGISCLYTGCSLAEGLADASCHDGSCFCAVGLCARDGACVSESAVQLRTEHETDPFLILATIATVSVLALVVVGAAVGRKSHSYIRLRESSDLGRESSDLASETSTTMNR